MSLRPPRPFATDQLTISQWLRAAAQAVQVGRWADAERLTARAHAEINERAALEGASTMPPPPDYGDSP